MQKPHKFTSKSSLRIASYNCKYFKSSRNEILELCRNNDIVLLQETWLLQCDLYLLNNLSSDHYAQGISSVNTEDKIHTGRPYGGLAILWHKRLGTESEVIILPGENRIMGLELKFQSLDIMIYNVYLPYCCSDNVQDFNDYLLHLSGIIEAADTPYVYCIGDFNADVKRAHQFGQKLRSFCVNENLCLADVERLPADTFTYQNISQDTKSWIDHILCPESANKILEEVSVDHTYITSDHFPITMNIRVQSAHYVENTNIDTTRIVSKRVKWSKCSRNEILQYAEHTRTNLELIQSEIPLSLCDDVTCRNPEHISGIERLYSGISSALVESSTCLLRNGTCKNYYKSEWTEEVSRHYSEARSAFLRWRQCGSARNIPEYIQMISTRATFKRILRKSKRNVEQNSANNMAKNLMNKDKREFWQSVQELRKNKNETQVTNIDNVSGNNNICGMWMAHYNGLLNSTKDDKNKEYVLNSIDPALDRYDLRKDGFKLTEIDEAIKALKVGKAPDCDDVQAEHFKYADKSVIHLLCLLFNASIVHSYLPVSLMNATVTPIVKDKRGDVTDKDNYRPITITTVTSKLLESIICNKFTDQLYTSDHQFGFKRHHSTDMCVFALKETISYYLSNNTPVYTAFMDVSKAFDKVNHWVLYSKLLKRGIPSSIVRLLVKWYSSQNFYVKWADHLSSSFNVSNGVRQGGVMSPILYNVFIDDLSVRLDNTYSGCYRNEQVFNHLFYADDSVLLAPSPHALQDLLDICQAYAEECDITYNAKKTKCMLFTPPSRGHVLIPKLHLNGKQLKWKIKQEYLGIVIYDDLYDDSDIQRQIKGIYARGNWIVRKFNACTADVKVQLFKTYIMNVYGAALWCKYSGDKLSQLETAYNKVFRLLFRIKKRETSVSYMNLRIDSFKVFFRKHVYSFTLRIAKSNNNLIRKTADAYSFYSTSLLYCQWQRVLYL